MDDSSFPSPTPPPIPILPKKISIKNKRTIKFITESPETEYISSFSEKEKKAYEIAKSHLLTSFSLNKSNGFIQFMKEREKEGEEGRK